MDEPGLAKLTPTTTTRDDAIDAIRREVERYGKPTPLALRIRLAIGISLADYRQAIQDGMTAHTKRKWMNP